MSQVEKYNRILAGMFDCIGRGGDAGAAFNAARDEYAASVSAAIENLDAPQNAHTSHAALIAEAVALRQELKELRDFNCCMCGSGVYGCTVHDFRFDKKSTRIDWRFCRNCSAIFGVPMLNLHLPPKAWRRFVEIAGCETFMTHSDFYDEEGNALQPSDES